MLAALDAIADFVFPPRCVGCGILTDGGAGTCEVGLCEVCAVTAMPPESACERCGTPGLEGAEQPAAAEAACGRCADGWSVDACWWAFEHGGAPQAAVVALKYKGRDDLARTLAKAFVSRGTWDLVVPVPLHRARLRRRGYNQAALLARPIGRQLGVPVAYTALARTKNTPPQASLSAGARRRNVAGAFRVRREPAVRGRRVLLIDDVVTTGATGSACARALRRAGATQIGLWSVARAV